MKGELKVSYDKSIVFVEREGTSYKVEDNGWLDTFLDSFGGMVGGKYVLFAESEIEGEFVEGFLVPIRINFPNFDEFIENVSLNFIEGRWELSPLF